MSLVATCTGVKIDQFWIPPFEIYDGELVGFFLYGDYHIYELQNFLMDIFTEKKSLDGIVIHQPITQIPLSYKRSLKDYFVPMTVDRFINTFEKQLSGVDFSALAQIGVNIKVHLLLPGQQKLLLLYKTLSETNRIVFNLNGCDPIILDVFLKQVNAFLSQNGGVSILLDHFDYKEICDKYYKVEMIK